MFSAHNEIFNTNSFNKVLQCYNIFNPEKLKNQLSVIYSTADFRCISGAAKLLNFIIATNLESTLDEVTKLLKICVTIPMTTSEPERCISTLNRIK